MLDLDVDTLLTNRIGPPESWDATDAGRALRYGLANPVGVSFIREMKKSSVPSVVRWRLNPPEKKVCSDCKSEKPPLETDDGMWICTCRAAEVPGPGNEGGSGDTPAEPAPTGSDPESEQTRECLSLVSEGEGGERTYCRLPEGHKDSHQDEQGLRRSRPSR